MRPSPEGGTAWKGRIVEVIRMGIVLGVVIAAAGAILRYATSATVSHLNLHLTGLILMIAGAVIAVLSFITMLVRRERIVHVTSDRAVEQGLPVAPAAPVTGVHAAPAGDRPVVDRPIVEEPARATGYDRPL